MRPFAFLIFAIMFAVSCGGSESTVVDKPAETSKPLQRPATGPQSVLVELFTSEGCGNCPPADQQLALLEKEQPFANTDVITLGYHVDYFNDRGWKDAYSAPEYTRRQQLYSMRMRLKSIYTPQMVVDGQAEFIGSDGQKASAAIAKAASVGKGLVDARMAGQTVQVNIADISANGPATAVLVTAEDGLTSDVRAGNNAGKKLSHISVVRRMQAVGRVQPDQAEFKGSVQVYPDPAWKAKNLRYIVYVQEDQSGHIIAAGRVKPAE
jgi:hypothetical protein